MSFLFSYYFVIFSLYTISLTHNLRNRKQSSYLAYSQDNSLCRILVGKTKKNKKKFTRNCAVNWVRNCALNWAQNYALNWAQNCAVNCFKKCKIDHFNNHGEITHLSIRTGCDDYGGVNITERIRRKRGRGSRFSKGSLYVKADACEEGNFLKTHLQELIVKEKMTKRLRIGVDKLIFVNRILFEIRKEKVPDASLSATPSVNEKKKQKKHTDGKCPREIEMLVEEDLSNYDFDEKHVRLYEDFIEGIINHGVIPLRNSGPEIINFDSVDMEFRSYLAFLFLDGEDGEEARCENGEAARCEHVEEARCEDGEEARCENGEAVRCEDVEEARCENGEAARCEDVEEARCEELEAARCEDVEEARCEELEAARCEDRCGGNKEEEIPAEGSTLDQSKLDEMLARVKREIRKVSKKLILLKETIEEITNEYEIEMEKIYIDKETGEIKVKRNRYQDSNEKRSNWKLIFLGTGSMYPSTSRGTSSFLLQITKKKFNDAFLFDCGENTFISLQKANIKVSKIKNIFITHLHGDHCLGLISVLTMLRNENTINIYGPEGIYRFLKNNINSTFSKRMAKFFVYEMKTGMSTGGGAVGVGGGGSGSVSITSSRQETPSDTGNMQRKKRVDTEYIFQNEEKVYPILKNEFLEILGFPIKHTVPTIGYVIKELKAESKFNASYINELIKKNYDKLKECERLEFLPYKIYENIIRKMNVGDVVELPDKTQLSFKNAYKEVYKERKIVVCQDTYDASSLENFAKDADVLIHEATNSLIDLNDQSIGALDTPCEENVKKTFGKNQHHQIHVRRKENIPQGNKDGQLNCSISDASMFMSMAIDYQTSENFSREKCDKKETPTNRDGKDTMNSMNDEHVVLSKGEKTNSNNVNQMKSPQENSLCYSQMNKRLVKNWYNKIISERGHSTANMAGEFAKKINAKKLILTHFSQRYIGDNKLKNVLIMRKIEREAQEPMESRDILEPIEPEPFLGNNSHGRRENIVDNKDSISKRSDKRHTVIAAYDGLIVHIPPQMIK
ncbi:metallo-hydrolase/oxidoreductase [Plasmodium gonderi]|uniref:Metallo-hydrolase/oxidoreductase n=1 Tax=Plasmodium gonderi TaxID=77519 RepID=A0A1Y1JA52_PLAGO|nr:metallo-hydrolase/oxidoreductase [Plasmodium gonderi]GAW79376.1 metallo-hydrolase/oxidoreductase [Plasmodium gonderi]